MRIKIARTILAVIIILSGFISAQSQNGYAEVETDVIKLCAFYFGDSPDTDIPSINL